ncbi:MAG: hypothetical protein V8T47_04430 [Oscillospiraceae bacterium]
MKRGIAILLAALLLGLCACSPTGADASEPGGTQPVTQPATQPATRGTEPETHVGASHAGVCDGSRRRRRRRSRRSTRHSPQPPPMRRTAHSA